jgi:DNA-binding GntR family transcriptional regulator
LFVAILQGELKPGDRVKQAVMGEKLNVGVGTFREAMHMLAGYGLISSGHPTVITQHTAEDAAILFALRQRLEPSLAFWVRRKLTPSLRGGSNFTSKEWNGQFSGEISPPF